MKARNRAWRRRQRSLTNTPIATLTEQYRDDCGFSDDLEWQVSVSLRYVETMPDSQVRVLLHALARRLEK